MVTDGVMIDGVRQRTDGVIVVKAKGASALAGIVENDIITAVQGRPTRCTA